MSYAYQGTVDEAVPVSFALLTDPVAVREWAYYQRKNRLAGREYKRNKATIDRRYGDG